MMLTLFMACLLLSLIVAILYCRLLEAEEDRRIKIQHLKEELGWSKQTVQKLYNLIDSQAHMHKATARRLHLARKRLNAIRKLSQGVLPKK